MFDKPDHDASPSDEALAFWQPIYAEAQAAVRRALKAGAFLWPERGPMLPSKVSVALWRGRTGKHQRRDIVELLVGEPSVVPWEFRGEAAPGAQDLGLAAKVGPGRALVAINADSLTAGLTAPVYRPHSLSSGSVRCPDPTWATALDHLRRVAAHEAVHLLRGDIVGATQHPPSFWDECQQLFGELGIGHVDCHRRGLAARERASGDWRTIW